MPARKSSNLFFVPALLNPPHLEKCFFSFSLHSSVVLFCFVRWAVQSTLLSGILPQLRCTYIFRCFGCLCVALPTQCTHTPPPNIFQTQNCSFCSRMAKRFCCLLFPKLIQITRKTWVGGRGGESRQQTAPIAQIYLDPRSRQKLFQSC